MRNYALFAAALSTTIAGCGAGGHSTPAIPGQKATAGTTTLRVLVPKGLKRAAGLSHVYAPNHGLRKHGVVKRPPVAKNANAKTRRPAFLDSGLATFLQITSQSVQNGVVVASTTVPQFQIGEATSTSVSIPIYAGTGVIIVREVDLTDPANPVALAVGQQTYSFTLGSTPVVVDIALSMVPAGLAVASADFPTPTTVPAGNGFPTANITQFNSCNGQMSGFTENFSVVPVDNLGTLPTGDGAVPSVNLLSQSPDNGGSSSISSTGIPGQYTINYDAAGDGVSATFKMVDAFNNVFTTTADLTDACTNSVSGYLLSVSTADPRFSGNVLSFSAPGDTPAQFQPVELLAAGGKVNNTGPITVSDDCGGAVTYDTTTSTYNTLTQTYSPITVTPVSPNPACTLTFSDGSNVSVTAVVSIGISFASPPPASPSTTLSVATQATPDPKFNTATSPPTLNRTTISNDSLQSMESSATVTTFPGVTITDTTPCTGILSVDGNVPPLSYLPAFLPSLDGLSASANVVVAGVGIGTCTLQFSDGVNSTTIQVVVANGAP